MKYAKPDKPSKMKEDLLFSLIRSLSPTEKRYFKLQNTVSADKAFMRLFDYLNAVEAYDEEALRSHFKGEKFLTNLPVIKGYLKNNLLVALRDFHRQNNVELQIRAQLDFVNVLKDRGIRKLALRELRKIKKQASAMGAQLVLIESLKLEISMLRFEQNATEIIASLRQQLRDALQAETQEAKASSLFDKVFHLVLLRLTPSDPAQVKRVEDLMHQAQNVLKEPGNGILGKLILFHSLFYCHELLGQKEEAWQYYQAIKDLFFEHPEFAKARPTMALKSYRGYLDGCLANQKLEKADPVMKAIEKLPLKSAANQAEAAAVIVYFQLKRAMVMKAFEEAADMEFKVKRLFKKHQELIPQSYQVNLYSELALSHVVSGRTKEAGAWLRKILEEPSSENRKDIREFARMMQLLVWMQQEDFELLEFELRNTERMLKRRGSFSEVDNTLIQFFKVACEKRNREKLSPDMKTLLTDLKGLRKEGKRHLGLDAFVEWLENELEKAS